MVSLRPDPRAAALASFRRHHAAGFSLSAAFNDSRQTADVAGAPQDVVRNLRAIQSAIDQT